MTKLAFVSLLLCACGSSTNEADDLSSLTLDTAAKADALAAGGAYQIDATDLVADDIVYLNLLPPSTKPGVMQDPSWVWNRCYDTPCSLFVPQDGSYEFYRSASGRKYVKLYTTHVGPSPGGPDLLDVYAYKLAGGKLELRKAGTSRWFAMTAFTDEIACNQSGGSYAGGACDCSALGTGAFNSPAQFQPGMGGCFLIPNSSEAQCDGTGGAYTDDDNNLVGSFCECGVGRYYADGAGCTSVPSN